MKHEHTPGPWSTFQDASLRHAVATATVRICDMWGKDPAFFTAEDAANARLIASAPDLLAALKALLESIESVDFSVLDDAGLHYDRIPWSQAETAIARATGEDQDRLRG